MSLLPLASRFWWDTLDYPVRLLDNQFGMGLDDADLLGPSIYRGRLLRPRAQRSSERSGQSEVVNDKDRFRVMLNVGHFQPREICVKTVDNAIVVHGKHEEKTDEHGFIAREFTRRYVLPEGAQPQAVTSSLTPDGILMIEAPKKAPEPPSVNERVVPIEVQKEKSPDKQ